MGSSIKTKVMSDAFRLVGFNDFAIRRTVILLVLQLLEVMAVHSKGNYERNGRLAKIVQCKLLLRPATFHKSE